MGRCLLIEKFKLTCVLYYVDVNNAIALERSYLLCLTKLDQSDYKMWQLQNLLSIELDISLHIERIKKNVIGQESDTDVNGQSPGPNYLHHLLYLVFFISLKLKLDIAVCKLVVTFPSWRRWLHFKILNCCKVLSDMQKSSIALLVSLCLLKSLPCVVLAVLTSCGK